MRMSKPFLTSLEEDGWQLDSAAPGCAFFW
jgi:hypothetical protein